MEIILGIDRLKRTLANPVATLGNFDGVHLGHQKIFERVRAEAAKLHGEAVVITFEPHPLMVLSPERCPPLLTPFRKKMTLIEESGIDTVLSIEFTAEFSRISPLKFVRDILVARAGVRKIIVGYNYHFGKDKGGDIETLKTMGRSFQMQVDVVEPMTMDGVIVSSSKIRELIRGGDVEMAAKLLGRDYPMIGKVVEGARRGRTLGFPTANVAPSDELYPKPGVYAVHVLWKGKRFNGVANIGVNPTFPSDQAGAKEKVSFEVYILDFDSSIYGEELQVNFKKRIRDEVRFNSAAELVRQIQEDVDWAKENVFKESERP